MHDDPMEKALAEVFGPRTPMSRPDPDRVAPPAGSGRYEFLDQIGAGGVGIVYLGRDHNLHRDVALKVLRGEYASRSDVLARFVDEAHISGQLQHPGIVPIYEVGLRDDERPYFAMKLISGETFAALLRRRASPDEDRQRMLGIFEQVCQTVAYAHARGVVHRDLKPGNVMIGRFGEVQVVDWGFAKVLDSDAPEPERAEPAAPVRSVRHGPGAASVEGAALGTPAYMAPEQAEGALETIDARTDVFALGAILCEILTGHAPYDPESDTCLEDARRADLTRTRARLAMHSRDPDLSDLCLDCMAPAPGDRPASAEEVARRVQEHLAALADRARRAELQATRARYRQRLTVLVGAAAVLLACAGAAFWTWRRDEVERQVTAALDTAADARLAAQAAGESLPTWKAAVAAAARTVDLARSLGARPDQLARAEELHRQVAAAEARAIAETARRNNNGVLLAALRRARIPADEDILAMFPRTLSYRRMDRAYAAAFERYLDAPLFERPEADALAALQGSGIPVDIAAALDHWALVRDAQTLANTPPDPARTALLRRLAARLDASDAARQELRRLLPEPAAHGPGLSALLERADPKRLGATGCRLLGEALVIAGEDAAARQALQRGHEAFPGDFDLVFLLGTQHEWRGTEGLAEAHRHYWVAHALMPDQHEVLYRLVLVLERMERADDAERTCRRLTEGAPDSVRGWLKLAQLQVARKDHAAAASSARKVLEVCKTPADRGDANRNRAKQVLGRCLIAQGDFVGGFDVLPDTSYMYPWSDDVLLDLARAVAKVDWSDDALRALERAAAEAPSVQSHAAHAEALLLGGHGPAAEAAFRRALTHLDRTDTAAVERVYLGLGAALRAQRRFRFAIEAYGEGLRHLPDTARLLTGRGLAWARRFQRHHQRGEVAAARSAEADLSRARQLDPKDPTPALILSALFGALGRIDDARALVKETLPLLEADDSLWSRVWRRIAARRIERHAELGAHIDKFLAGEIEPLGSLHWTRVTTMGVTNRRYAEVIEHTKRTLRTAPHLIQTNSWGLYSSAGAAVLLAAQSSGDAKRAELLDLAHEWLGREVDTWVEWRRKSRELAETMQGMARHAMSDPTLETVRGPALQAMPEQRRRAWEQLWTKVRSVLDTPR